jgi:hypothetical protein
MLDHYKTWYSGHKVLPPLLFLVGEPRRDIIPKTLMDPELPADKRIQVDELVVYGTGVMESFEKDFAKLLQDTDNRAARWVIVYPGPRHRQGLQGPNRVQEQDLYRNHRSHNERLSTKQVWFRTGRLRCKAKSGRC